MMSSFTLFNATIASGVALVGGAATVVCALLGLTMATVFCGAIVMLAMLFALTAVHRTRRGLGAATEVCSQIGWGNFEVRAKDYTEAGEVRELMTSMNHMIDRTDAFLREAAASMTAIENNRYYRRIQPGGLNGSYLQNAEIMNMAIETIKGRVGAFRQSTDSFESQISQIAQSLMASAEQMTGTAEEMETSAVSNSEVVTAIADAADLTA